MNDIYILSVVIFIIAIYLITAFMFKLFPFAKETARWQTPGFPLPSQLNDYQYTTPITGAKPQKSFSKPVPYLPKPRRFVPYHAKYVPFMYTTDPLDKKDEVDGKNKCSEIIDRKKALSYLRIRPNPDAANIKLTAESILKDAKPLHSSNTCSKMEFTDAIRSLEEIVDKPLGGIIELDPVISGMKGAQTLRGLYGLV